MPCVVILRTGGTFIINMEAEAVAIVLNSNRGLIDLPVVPEGKVWVDRDAVAAVAMIDNG